MQTAVDHTAERGFITEEGYSSAQLIIGFFEFYGHRYKCGEHVIKVTGSSSFITKDVWANEIKNIFEGSQ